MALLLSSDKLYPDSVDKLNAKFDQTDAALATKLDKSGGTMAGDIVMGSHKITGLPAPAGAGEPAVYGHSHDDRYFTESESDARFAALSHTHDDRYFTEAESDSRYLSTGYLSGLVRTTLDQIIDGIKTFAQNILVKKASPSIELLNTDGTQLARLWATATPEALMRLEIGNGGGYTTMLEVMQGSGHADFPVHDIYVKSKKLATEEYVQQRVRSGSAYMTGQTAYLSQNASGYTQVSGADQIIVIPNGMRITMMSVVGTAQSYSRACSVGGVAAIKLHASDVAGEPTFSIRTTAGAVLFSFVGDQNTGSTFAFTLTVSV